MSKYIDYNTTRDRNIQFLELYKSVDRFIRDAYASDEGLSTYLRIMENESLFNQRYVPEWEDDHKMLKRVKWIRNQFSHEMSYDSDICEESDHKWLASFYNRLLSSSDPLSMAEKRKQQVIQRRKEACIKRKEEKANNHSDTIIPEQKSTFWQRIKKLFSRN